MTKSMKRFKKVAHLSMVVLMGVLGLIACSSNEEVVDNPNYNPETGEVNTQFVFTVSTSSESTTRESSAQVQANDGSSDLFRGMEKVSILAYIQGADGHHLSSPVKADRNYDLATILPSGAISETEASRVIELSLPLNVNTLMFYGKAIKDGSDNDQGSIDYNVSDNPDDTYFRLKNRLTDTELHKQTCQLIQSIISRVVECGLHKETTGQARDLRYAFSWNQTSSTGIELTETTTPARSEALTHLTEGVKETSYTDGENKIYVGTLNWKDLGDQYAANTSMTPLEEILGSTYYAFTNIRPNEVRAGSAKAICRTIDDLWTTNNKVKNAIPTSAPEFKAQILAKRLDERFANYFVQSGGDCTFQPVTILVTHLKENTNVDPSSFSAVQEVNQFPMNLNLPAGSVQLTFDKTTGKFSYVESSSIVLGMDGNSDLARMMWPAELCYFGNSPIRVSGVSKTSADYPKTVVEWENDANDSWTTFAKDGHVMASTRAVAMQNDINYGTALMKSTVSIVDPTLYDNNSAMHDGGEADNSIDASTQSGLFRLKGILIGGQNNEMGWNYLRKYEADETDANNVSHSSSFNYVVYDNAIGAKDDNGNYAGIVVPEKGAVSAPNYTLLFDNYNSLLGPDEQSDVFVALELENNTGADFFGQDGLIRANGIFYIVGKIDVSEATNYNTIKFPVSDGSVVEHPLPPYDASGKTIPAKRAFIQDYMTTVNFQIGAHSLKNAFATVPDLRATNISLGMAVDLKWEPGLNFVVDLGK